MKKISRIICISLTAILCTVSCQKKGNYTINTEEPSQLSSQNDSISWAMGSMYAQDIIASGIEVDRDILVQALFSTLDGKTPLLDQGQMVQMQNIIEQRFYATSKEKYEKEFQAQRSEEQAYFTQLTQKNPNVKKSDKGFYYEVLKEGTGRKAEKGLIVDFDYKGTFTNGQIFDQTYGNRPSIVHLVDESLMPGLREGFCMMNAGSTYRFYFPCEMAFGEQGTEDIPPFTTVIYEVELHDVHE